MTFVPIVRSVINTSAISYGYRKKNTRDFLHGIGVDQ